MTSDRELLELAAKAAGYDLHNLIHELTQQPFFFYIEDSAMVVWNPLTDDGDALRLAVRLDITVEINRVDGFTIVKYGYCTPLKIRENHSNDPYAATRRAIVRAAAEIGKNIK